MKCRVQERVSHTMQLLAATKPYPMPVKGTTAISSQCLHGKPVGNCGGRQDEVWQVADGLPRNRMHLNF